MSLRSTDVLERGSLADTVAERLRRRIASGEFAPEARLPTGGALAVEYGVSMSVIREALSRLKHDGLIRSVQGAGAFVAPASQSRVFRIDDAPVDHDSLARIFELRLAVEGEAAWLAARRREAHHVAAMHAALQDMSAAISRQDDGIAADTRFHQLVADATGNPLFSRMFGFLSSQIATAIEMARINSARHGTLAQAHREHTELLEAIEARHPDRARATLISHIRSAAERLGLRVGEES